MEAQRGKIIRTKNTPSSGDRRERKKRFDVQGRTLRDASTHAEACKKKPEESPAGHSRLIRKNARTFAARHKYVQA